ncbi:MAG: CPBP family intramembrane metalloprotease [Bacteroidales bacterium]|nr:CPBP family intramembrane metalloprotease [Bacteroidales bacterium]
MKFWLHLWFLLLALGIGFLLLFLGIFIIAFLPFVDQSSMIRLTMWGQNIILALSTMAWVWLVRIRKQPVEGGTWFNIRQELNIRRFDWKLVLIATLAYAAMTPFIDTLSVFFYHLPWPDGLRTYMETESANNWKVMQSLLDGNSVASYIHIILLVCVATGIGEEFFFRGALLNCMRRSTQMNAHIIALLVGLIFAAIHFELYGLPARWILGTLLVYLVYWTRSIWPSIWIHFLNNLLGIISLKCATPEELANQYQEYQFNPFFSLACTIVAVLLWAYLYRLSTPKEALEVTK